MGRKWLRQLYLSRRCSLVHSGALLHRPGGQCSVGDRLHPGSAEGLFSYLLFRVLFQLSEHSNPSQPCACVLSFFCWIKPSICFTLKHVTTWPFYTETLGPFIHLPYSDSNFINFSQLIWKLLLVCYTRFANIQIVSHFCVKLLSQHLLTWIHNLNQIIICIWSR